MYQELIYLMTLLWLPGLAFDMNAKTSKCPVGKLQLGYGEDKDGTYLDCRILNSNPVSSNVEVYFNISVRDRLLAHKKFGQDITQATFRRGDLSIGLAGLEIICSYLMMTSSEKCNVTYSNTMKFGMKCPEVSGEIGFSQEILLVVALTAPYDFYCAGNDCGVYVRIDFPDNMLSCRYSTDKAVGLAPVLLLKNESCDTYFNSTNWNSGIYLRIMKNRNLFVQAQPVENRKVNIEVIYENKMEINSDKCKEITVSSRMYSIYQYYTCYSRTDPHIRTFSNTYFDHHEEGEYIMYMDEASNVQVRTKQRKCLDLSKVGCNHAASVQIGNAIFVYEVIYGRLDETTYNVNTTSKITRRVVVLNKNYEIQLPNGDTVCVWLESKGISMTIKIRQPVRIPSIKGFCSINEASQAPSQMASYRIQDTDSNFIGIPRNTKLWIKENPIQTCRCEKRKTCTRSEYIVDCI